MLRTTNSPGSSRQPPRPPGRPSRAALPDEAREKVERDADIVGDRFVLQLDKKRQEVQRLLGTDFGLMVVRPVALCELPVRDQIR